jgi:hypothetical protein
VGIYEYVVTLRVRSLEQAHELQEDVAESLGPDLIGATIRRARQLPETEAMTWLRRELSRPGVRPEGHPAVHL